jgi:hypothetical protein
MGVSQNATTPSITTCKTISQLPAIALLITLPSILRSTAALPSKPDTAYKRERSRKPEPDHDCRSSQKGAWTYSRQIKIGKKQRHSQWYKRTNSHNLNQSGPKVEDKGLNTGDRVYFYKPPTQQEIARRGRKAKHLAHYHDPATVQGKIDGRDRQYHIMYDGKLFKRDISMLDASSRKNTPSDRRDAP